jgi:DNA-binding response OmpR family regulator
VVVAIQIRLSLSGFQKQQLKREGIMGSEQQTVLVIDDNEDIRNLLSMVLEKDGYLVLQGIDASDGLEKIEGNKTDLVLLDVMMPGVSGLDLLTTIRDHKKKEINSVPICMITAKSSVEDIDKALDLGATSYIVKPFRPTALSEKVKALLTPSN